jgi:hypothetical protein
MNEGEQMGYLIIGGAIIGFVAILVWKVKQAANSRADCTCGCEVGCTGKCKCKDH